MDGSDRPLAVVAGASTGIGFQLARCCAENGFDLVIAAGEPEIADAADGLRALGVAVDTVVVDLAAVRGVDRVVAATNGRPVDALVANAGYGLGGAFLDQDFARVRHVVETNIIGTLYLVQRVGLAMRERGAGRILVTGSIAGLAPGTYQAVYNGTKAFLDSFAYALRAELQGSGVTVTCLMPGATEVDFFERADLLGDAKLAGGRKQSPVEIARLGFAAMMNGDGDVIAGWTRELRAAISHVPASLLAARAHKRPTPAPGPSRR